ncbi:hypothetical protein [Kitasatospora sp. HPMI-4]|uniref:hypothetical protein n=1 Tax=Kitasatospora sp. HPMI-4 TaxID=3448443 RepID=UPI003F196348
MGETQGEQPGSRLTRLFGGCALERHRLLLGLVGAACVAVGILVAVAVPESDGPAWAMAVAGCLAAGVLLLVRVALALFRSTGP